MSLSKYKQSPLILPWQKIIEDLHDAGLSYNKIATLINVKWSTFQDCPMKPGSEPKESVGTALLNLHTEYLGEEYTQMRKSQGKPRE